MIDIVEGDLHIALHAAAVVSLLDEYASDPLGGGDGLCQFAKDNLVQALRQRSTAYIILGLDGKSPAGLVTCFEGFSTFACRPLLNIHDVIVSSSYRGQGLAKRMLTKVEEHALATGCCKLTLEVLEGNLTAQKVYRDLEFANYQLDPTHGRAMFWQKLLQP